MENTQHVKCETSSCIYCRDGACIKGAEVTIRDHRCADYREFIALPDGTVTIEVSGGVVQNAYASPDLPPISVELIDFDNLRDAAEDEYAKAQQKLKAIKKHHTHIF